MSIFCKNPRPHWMASPACDANHVDDDPFYWLRNRSIRDNASQPLLYNRSLLKGAYTTTGFQSDTITGKWSEATEADNTCNIVRGDRGFLTIAVGASDDPVDLLAYGKIFVDQASLRIDEIRIAEGEDQRLADYIIDTAQIMTGWRLTVTIPMPVNRVR